MTVANVAVATTKFLFGICACTVDSDVGAGNFSLVLRVCRFVDTLTCNDTYFAGYIVIHLTLNSSPGTALEN